jgi:hypothetical protein
MSELRSDWHEGSLISIVAFFLPAKRGNSVHDHCLFL